MPFDTRPELYVQPGESQLVLEPVVIRTLLGSCVGITFLAPRKGIAALCHPMLPHCPANRLAKLSRAARGRYVDLAIGDISQQLDALGVTRAETQVKLFGGGDVLAVADNASRPTVGQLNGESALRTLSEEGFEVSVSILGGKSGVQIQFDTGTGEVLLRRLDSDSRKRSHGWHRATRGAQWNR
jgi:chemotaxis protein CheD